MTDGIRSMIKTRRRLFKKTRRKEQWKELKLKIENIVQERKKVNHEHIIQSFKTNKDTKNFHKAVNKLLGENSPPRWAPEQLYPDKTHAEAAEESAAYFNNISQEYQPLTEHDIPTSHSRPLTVLTLTEVANMLKNCKKKHSLK